MDIYGRCTEGIFSVRDRIRDVISPHYLFYLSFENSFCTDYVTEKFFRYFEWDVVLVVRGGADYDRLLPNDTFIDASKFSSAKELSEFLLEIAKSEEKYTHYLRNKDKYRVQHFSENVAAWCNICWRLNNLIDYRKTYSDHVTYLNHQMCYDPEDISPTFNYLVFIVTAVSIFVFASVYIYRKTKRKEAVLTQST